MAQGSVRKRGKKWYYRYYIRDESGKLVQKGFAGAQSKAETQALLRRAIQDYEDGRLVNKVEQMTVRDLLDLWIEEALKPGDLSNGTVALYQSTARRIKEQAIGAQKLKGLTPAHLQEFFDILSLGKMRDNGSLARPLAPGSILPYSAVMKSVFSFAVFPKQLMEHNPMQYVRVSHGRREDTLFSEEKTSMVTPYMSHDKFLLLTDYLNRKKNPAWLPVLIAYYTGLRIGEVCGLSWQDIDLEEQFLTVRHSTRYNDVRHKAEIGAPKRNKIRTVDFCTSLKLILQEAKAQQQKNRTRFGRDYYLNYYRRVQEKGRCYYELYSLPCDQEVPKDFQLIDLVCLRHDGRFESACTLRNACRSAAQRIPELAGFHFHHLRHTFTSNMLRSGAAPKDVQELLGHRDIRTTMNIYAHASQETKRSLARRLDQVVGKG